MEDLNEILDLLHGDVDELEFLLCRFCDTIEDQLQNAQQIPSKDLSTACFQSISLAASQALNGHESNDAKVDAFEEDAIEIDESSGSRIKRKGLGGFMSDLITKVKDTAKKVVEGDTRAKLATQLAASQRLIQEGLPVQYGLLRIEIVEAHSIPSISKTALTDSFCRAFVVPANTSQSLSAISRHNLYVTKTQIGRTEPAWLEQFSLAFAHVILVY